MAGKPFAVDECRTYSFRNKHRCGKSGIAFTGRTWCAFCYSTPDLEQRKFGDLRTPLLSGTILTNADCFMMKERFVFQRESFVAVWWFFWVRFFHWIPACAGMTVMRYFGIRFMLRILFFQKIQRQALQEYRRKERSNKIENCDSLGSWNPGLKLQRFFFSWSLILE